MSARVVNKQEKRDQVLAAALQVFSKKGFTKSTISDIAAAAGMGKGTVYEYFATKEEIIQNSFAFFMRHLELDFEEVLISGLPAMEKLKKILDGFAHFIDDHNFEMMELMFDFWSEALKAKSTRGFSYIEMGKFYNAYRTIFADIIVAGMGEGTIRKDINPKSAASLIVGALDGIMVQWILDRENFDHKDVVRTISLTFLDGITVRS